MDNMKKICFGMMILLAACNNDGASSKSEDTTVTNLSGVENVNGNMPDTQNAISIEGTSDPVNARPDSTQKK